MQSSYAGDDPSAIFLQLARVYHTEVVNIQLSADSLRQETESTFRPLLEESWRLKDRDMESELRLRLESVRQQCELVTPASLRRVESYIRLRIGQLLTECRVQLKHGVSRTVVVQKLYELVRMYCQDCNEKAMLEAAKLIMHGRFGSELLRAQERIGGVGKEATAALTEAHSEFQNSSSMATDPTKTYRARLTYPCCCQWTERGQPACASIAVAACEVFLKAQQNSLRRGVSLDEYLLTFMDWSNVVRSGTEFYTRWRKAYPNIKEAYQLVDEAVKKDSVRYARLVTDFSFDEIFGSLFVPRDLDEGFGTDKSFGELIERIKRGQTCKENKPLACAFSSKWKTLAFARTPGGIWWLFDSHGSDRQKKSTLGRFLNSDELVAYVESFFGVDSEASVDIDSKRSTTEETALTTAVAFNAFMFYKK